MKLPLSLLKKYIHLPTDDVTQLRKQFDDLGLEVEEILYEGDDVIFKIETLAHRGDHLYAQGIAREFSARYLIPTLHPKIVEEIPAFALPLEVSVETQACLRYALMSLEAGSSVVDMLNAILAELGQPMHAFDQEKIEGSLRVTTNQEDVEIVALDEKKYLVPSGSILICDSTKIVAVAGVIGCHNSMVTAKTKKVFIESASFDPVSVRKTAKKMGISTDASYTFERGCDREKVLFALKRLLALLPLTREVGLYYYPGPEAKKRHIPLSLSRLQTLLNAPAITREEVEERLLFLGYEVISRDPDTVLLAPPSWREWNVQTEATIIEDFARTCGLNSFELSLPPLDYKAAPLHESEIFVQKIEPPLLGNGFCEVITKSYYSQEVVSFLNELQPGVDLRHVAIKNSVERDSSHLKITNLVHLARLSEYNLRRGVTSFKAYECARLFSMHQESSSYEYERDVLSLAVAGRWYSGEWKEEESLEEKALLLKGVLEEIFTSLGCELSVKESLIAFLHPGQQASLYVKNVCIGFFGNIHPQLKTSLQLGQDLLYAEIDVSKIYAMIPPARNICCPCEFPSIKRDLTLKLPRKVLASTVIDCIKKACPQYLCNVCIVNTFEKKEEDFRRVTYRLSFQSSERTLQHAEIDAVIEDLLTNLQNSSFSLCL